MGHTAAHTDSAAEVPATYSRRERRMCNSILNIILSLICGICKKYARIICSQNASELQLGGTLPSVLE